MFIKYRVNEVAKDFGETSKKILKIVNDNFPGTPKKTMTALEENELNVVFDLLTKEHEVQSFDEYFASRTEKEKKPQAQKDKESMNAAQSKADRIKAAREAAGKLKGEAAKPDEKKDETKPADKKPQETAAQQKPAYPPKTAPVRTAAPAARQQSAPARTQQNNPAAQGNNQNRGDRNAQQGRPQRTGDRPQGGFQRTDKPQPQPQPQQRPPKQKSAAKQPLNRKPLEGVVDENGFRQVVRRTVDTRSATVDLEKYNEKFEQLAPERSRRDSMVTKQKLTQRSQQYRGKPKNSRKETEAERIKRIERERKAKTLVITVPDEITVGDLAVKLKATAAQVITKLMGLGMMATVNEVIDFDTASLVADEFHAKAEREVVVTIEERIIDDSVDTDENLQPRSPIVVVMGHVDHGKTSLLDAIRHSHVTATEAGGITQHIGAYRVPVGDKEITFLDTPGHAAFTSMRARGAQVTDIAILVVAADDGIMPQTVEAINHAKAANVSIIVAINKMDKEGANPDRIMQQLTEYELVPEAWGGDVICVPVSAVTKRGIDELLEMVILTADMKELKANPDRAAKGTVIEARLDKGRGPVATILVQNGTLHSGDVVVAGTAVGRVRAMTNDRGEKCDSAGPSMPVEITGLGEVPSAGDTFDAVSDERLARELVEQRRQAQKEEQFKSFQKVTLDNLFESMQQGEMKELNIIVKADVQGSVEAVRQSLEKLSNDEVVVKVIHGGVGAVSESDVMLANASNAIIVGFNVRPQPTAQEMAERENVEIRLYRIIYDCLEEIEAAMKGMLAPKFHEVQIGRVEVRNTFKISSVGTIAGCYVLDGKVTRNAQLRVVRDGIVIAEDKIDSLRRFKDDVKEVAQGFECGIGLEKYNDVKEGDIYELFVMEEIKD